MTIPPHAVEFYRRRFAEAGSRDEILTVAMLAYVQLTLEGLCEDPDWASVVDRPADAAKVSTLRAILDVAASFGVIPDESLVGDYSKALAGGYYLRELEHTL
jgi:hypothetical protein